MVYRHIYEEPETETIEDVECIDETPLAIQILINEEICYWVPKSLIHDDSEVRKRGDKGSIVLPVWFCEQEGLV